MYTKIPYTCRHSHPGRAALGAQVPPLDPNKKKANSKLGTNTKRIHCKLSEQQLFP